MLFTVQKHIDYVIYYVDDVQYILFVLLIKSSMKQNSESTHTWHQDRLNIWNPRPTLKYG